MSVKLKLFLSILLLFNFVLIIKRLKLKKLSIRFGVMWTILVVFLELSVLYPNVYFVLSRFLGFEKTSNMIFLLSFFFLFYIIFILIINISQLNEKAKNLIQEISILKESVAKNERKK